MICKRFANTTCLLVNRNLCGKSVSLPLSIIFGDNLIGTPVPFFVTDSNLSSC